MPFEEARKNALSIFYKGFKEEKHTQKIKFEMIAYFQELARYHAESYADYSVGDLIVNGTNNVQKTQDDIRELTGVMVDLSSYKYKKPKDPHPVNIEHLLEPAIEALDE